MADTPPPYYKGSGFQVLPGGCTAQISPILVNYAIENCIKASLESYKVSSNGFSMMIGITNGYPVLKAITPKPDRENRYYAEQAMWDVPPQLLGNIGVAESTFELNQKAQFHHVCENVVFIDLIPIAASKNFAQITNLDISAPENVKAISIDKVDNMLLANLRRERFDFFKQNNNSQTSRQEILAFRDYLSKKYQTLFQERKEAAQ